jgi:hypothetical protein
MMEIGEATKTVRRYNYSSQLSFLNNCVQDRERNGSTQS